jgi:hypothetical protein
MEVLPLDLNQYTALQGSKLQGSKLKGGRPINRAVQSAL